MFESQIGMKLLEKWESHSFNERQIENETLQNIPIDVGDWK